MAPYEQNVPLEFNAFRPIMSIIPRIEFADRPLVHFTAPVSWLNDPCAPAFHNGTYHLFYQFCPNKPEWTLPLVWGHATSPDLVSWIDQPIALGSDSEYDSTAVFSGGSFFDDEFRIYYTGVRSIPIRWQNPYPLGIETQNMATAIDPMLTVFKKHPANPLIPFPPLEDIIGFRDPHVFTSREFDKLFGLAGRWMLLSGGRMLKGGAIFLYFSEDGLEWLYMGVIMSFTQGSSIGGFSEWGHNWERADFFRLLRPDGAETAYFLMSFGIEGSSDPWIQFETSLILRFKDTVGRHTNGDLDIFEVVKVEKLDHGNFYGSTSFTDTFLNPTLSRDFAASARQVKFGWIREFPAPPEPQSNWAGCMSLPRQIGIQSRDGNEVLFIAPVEETEAFRDGAEHRLILPTDLSEFALDIPLSPQNNSAIAFELKLTLSSSNDSLSSMFWITLTNGVTCHLSLSTTTSSTVIISRNSPKTTILFTKSPNTTFHIHFDVSVMEIFINNEVAWTGRIYPTSASMLLQVSYDNKQAETGAALGLGIGMVSGEAWVGLRKKGRQTQRDDHVKK